MPTILAHRGNIDGPSPPAENSLAAVTAALQRGWGVEIDIRRARDGSFYVSHDAMTDPRGCDAAPILAAIASHPRATVAVNVKELGDEAALLAELDRFGIVPQCVLFDFELLEPSPGATARTLRRLHDSVRLAARISDRDETVSRALSIEVASVIWLDEFDGPWCTPVIVDSLKAAGRRIYAVSPDLHGGSLEEARRRWDDFIAWDVDGICTDYPEALARRLESHPLAVAL